MIALGLVLLLLIIFVAQNTQKVNVSFLGWDGQTPLAVALLIAAAAGLFIAAVAGSLRILQLRRRVKRGASVLTDRAGDAVRRRGSLTSCGSLVTERSARTR